MTASSTGRVDGCHAYYNLNCDSAFLIDVFGPSRKLSHNLVMTIDLETWRILIEEESLKDWLIWLLYKFFLKGSVVRETSEKWWEHQSTLRGERESLLSMVIVLKYWRRHATSMVIETNGRLIKAELWTDLICWSPISFKSWLQICKGSGYLLKFVRQLYFCFASFVNGLIYLA